MKRKKQQKSGGGFLASLIVLGCFCTLASYSYDKHGPTHREPDLGEFIAQKIAEYDAETRPVALFHDGEPVRDNSIGDDWLEVVYAACVQRGQCDRRG